MPVWTEGETERVRALIRTASFAGSVRTARWPLPDGGLWIVAAAPQNRADTAGGGRSVWVAACRLEGVDLDQLVPRSDRFVRIRQATADDATEPAEQGLKIGAVDEDWLRAAVPLTDGSGALEGVLEMEVSRAPFRGVQRALRLGFVALLGVVALAGVAGSIAADRAIRVDVDRRRTEERFRAVTESVPDAIMVVREDRIVAWNPAAERIFRRERGEVLGRPLAFAVGPMLSAHLLALARQTEHFSTPHEVELSRADGETFPAEVTGGAWTTDEGSFCALVVRDITSRKAAEAERARMVEHFQQAQRLESLGVLAGGLAHDFNNLLATILGHAEMAAVAETPEDLAQCLQAVRTAGQRASELVRQLLVYAGRAPAAMRRLDLSAVLSDARGLLESAAGHSARLELQLEHDLPPVVADAGQIIQAAVNLVMNAAEALGDQSDGHIRLRTFHIRGGAPRFEDAVLSGESRQGNWTGFEVSDNGPGIPGDVRLRIFEPFFSTRFQGRGLGLPVVVGIVRAHGGALKLSSEPGRGTSVMVLFPAVDEMPNPDVGASAGSIRSSAASASGLVLVVDDDPLVRDVASRMLQRLSVPVETADSGASALDQFARCPSKYRAVLLDWTMPDMDGLETLCRLRQIRPDIPVIVASGDETLALPEADGLRVNGFLPKPFHFDTMAKVLAACSGVDAVPSSGSDPGKVKDTLSESVAV